MVTQQLHGDHGQDGLEGVHRLGHFDVHVLLGESERLLVTGLANQDRSAIPKFEGKFILILSHLSLRSDFSRAQKHDIKRVPCAKLAP